MKSVGSILKSARERHGLCREEVQQEIKIHPRFLRALEEGDYSAFSSPVHVKGFLRTYARFLDLDVEEVMAFFRREYDERREQKSARPSHPLKGLRVSWTPGLIVGAVGALLVLAFFGYLLWGYRHYASTPFLAVDVPASDISTTNAVIEVEGRASKGAEVVLNGERLSLLEDGHFRSTVSLKRGVNTLEFTAVNPFGREAKITRTVVLEVSSEGSESETQ